MPQFAPDRQIGRRRENLLHDQLGEAAARHPAIGRRLLGTEQRRPVRQIGEGAPARAHSAPSRQGRLPGAWRRNRFAAISSWRPSTATAPARSAWARCGAVTS